VRTRSTRSNVTGIVVVVPLVVLLLLVAQPLGVRTYGEPVTAPGQDDIGT